LITAGDRMIVEIHGVYSSLCEDRDKAGDVDSAILGKKKKKKKTNV
jgi:hypothetical protein